MKQKRKSLFLKLKRRGGGGLNGNRFGMMNASREKGGNTTPLYLQYFFYGH